MTDFRPRGILFFWGKHEPFPIDRHRDPPRARCRIGRSRQRPAAAKARRNHARAPTPVSNPAQAVAPGSLLSEEESGITQAPAVEGKPGDRASAYYDFTMGHVYEQQFENTSKPDFATQAIDFYKKAYALDPKSPVIGERLAEMYWKARREHDAITEAQEILKRDPNDVPTRRLLARIYIRSLGDLSSTGGQTEIADRAIEQYKEIYKLDRPTPNPRSGSRASIAFAMSTTKPKTSSTAS